jgi:hypothetical protein
LRRFFHFAGGAFGNSSPLIIAKLNSKLNIQIYKFYAINIRAVGCFRLDSTSSVGAARAEVSTSSARKQGRSERKNARFKQGFAAPAGRQPS